MQARLGFALLMSSLAASIALIASACGDDEKAPATTQDAAPEGSIGGDAGPRGLEQAGQACTSAAQCYLDKTATNGDAAGAPQLSIKGTVTCLDKVPNGYCTHECKNDSDCCAVPGECRTSVKQVCSPFTNSSETKYCFLSCEDGDINAAVNANASAGFYDGGVVDGGAREDEYCRSYASVYATCRSSGGGNENRKVCIPQQ